MRNKNVESVKKRERHSRLLRALVILFNVILLLAAFAMYALYNDAYRKSLNENNLRNIANQNRSAAANTAALFESWDIKLDDISKYVTLHSLNVDETLDYINDSNSNAGRYYELIGSDYMGYLANKSADGSYKPLDYSSDYSSLQEIFKNAGSDISDGIHFTPKFTDGELAVEVFAVYKYLTVKNARGESENYTLLLAAESKSIIATLNAQNSYGGQSTVMIDNNGDYIISNDDYKSTNLFDYLCDANDLSLDEKNRIRDEFRSNEQGELYYKNSSNKIEDCVFRYEKMSSSGWYCVTCVPISSFGEPDFNNSYILYAIILLVILFAVDILFLQKFNRELRKSVESARIANKSKSMFLSRMSHEIRTPLNAIIGYNSIAKSELVDVREETEINQHEIKVLDCLTKSEIASKHLLTVINDVLDMSAIESGKIKIVNDRFDFRGLITSLTTVFYSQAKSKGVEFDVIFGTLTEEWFIGDQMRVNQILTNLLSNAIKFTPHGGSVVLKITQPEAETDASHIHFEITDTGIGMSPEYISHIFTPFEQADSTISRRFGGSGLGLSITKNLIDLMGGTIFVESTNGIGSKFSVDLTFQRAEQPKSSSHYDFSTVNALIVDDDISTCDYIRLLFNRCGAKCAAVTSGEDAIRAVTVALKSDNKYTVCLIDWRMPNTDSLETIRRIRKIAGADIPIIVISAYDYTELVDKAMEIGINRFISKPLFQSSLFDLLANICGSVDAVSDSENEKYDFSGNRVLLTEDNAMNMEITTTILQSAGLVVDSAWNGREAVELFNKSEPGYYKAILMDVHMPEMNGHEATQAIRASSHGDAKTIPIIAMTADAFAENVAEAFASGMNEHIAKPIDVPTLFNILQRYLKQ